MGSIIGAGIGAVGSIIGGQQSAKAAKQSAQIQAAAQDRAGERALTGYKYLTEGAGAAPMNNYIQSGQRALNSQGGVQNMMMDLLGVSGYMNTGQGGQGGGQSAPAPAQGPQPNALAQQPGGAGGPPLYPNAGYNYGQLYAGGVPPAGSLPSGPQFANIPGYGQPGYQQPGPGAPNAFVDYR